MAGLRRKKGGKAGFESPFCGPSVHIERNLSWECHINEISKKTTSGISAIKRIRYFLPFEILLNVYNSL